MVTMKSNKKQSVYYSNFISKDFEKLWLPWTQNKNNGNSFCSGFTLSLQ